MKLFRGIPRKAQYFIHNLTSGKEAHKKEEGIFGKISSLVGARVNSEASEYTRSTSAVYLFFSFLCFSLFTFFVKSLALAGHSFAHRPFLANMRSLYK
jgi:hypothetical protein